MRIDVFSDVVCPWCYVGIARFESALAAFAHRDEVEVVHRSFELDPRHPAGETTTVLGMLAQKYGMSAAQAEAAEQRVAGLAAAEGLPYSGNRLHGNSLDAHRLLHLAAGRGRHAEVRPALYRGHFSGRRNIFDRAELTAVVAEAGLDRAEVDAVLGSDRYADAVRADEREAATLGIRGVPYLVLDGRLGVSGAQPTDTFRAALEQAWGTRGAAAASGRRPPAVR